MTAAVKSIQIVVMSGVEDGNVITMSQERDGYSEDTTWTITIGRREDNDISLRNDTYISRQHANLRWRDNAWWLEDCNSTNGSFVENPTDFFNDERIHSFVPIAEGQLFRVGRTWLRLQATE